jgi:hypothetical protein
LSRSWNVRIITVLASLLAVLPAASLPTRATAQPLREMGIVMAAPNSLLRTTVTDPTCNHGRGAMLSLPPWLSAPGSTAVTLLPDGATLVALSSFLGTTAAIYALTKSCSPDASFGTDGIEQVALGDSAHPRHLALDAMIPAVGGGVIVAGQSADRWLVGRLDPNGQVDSTFGSDGWALLPWEGAAAAIVQEPSGRIIVGGNTDTPSCCRSSVSELSRQGALVTSFGAGGEAPVASIHDGGLSRVAIGYRGAILALTWGGNFGCWTTLVSALTPLGQPVPSFEQRFVQGLKTAFPSSALPSGVFVADLVLQPSGFALVGTEQQRCIGNTPDPTVAGRIVSFSPGGQLNATFANKGIANFASSMMGPVWALRVANGGLLVVGARVSYQTKATEQARLNVISFSPDGKLNPVYGEDGRAQVLLPYRNESSEPIVPLSVAGNGKTFVILASSANPSELELVRLFE